MTMRPALERKAPAEVKDYGVAWERYLAAGVTISNSSWAVPAGITRITDSVDGLNTVIRLSGGTADQDYTLENTIITSTNETLVQALEVQVRTPALIAGID